MKILKYILIVIVALVVIFFAVGLMNPSVGYGHEIKVSKQVKEAWAVSQDETKLALWLDGFKSTELISGEKGAVGAKSKIIVNPGEGQPDFEMIETIVSRKDFDHMEMHFDSEPMNFEQIITFKEVDGGTTIKTDSKVIGKGLMSRSMFALMEMMSGAFTAQETRNMEALKALIEENTTDYYPAPMVTTEMDSVTAEADPQ